MGLIYSIKQYKITVYMGFLLVLISACSYALTPILAKLAYANGATPATVVLIRFIVGAIMFIGIWRTDPHPLNITGSILAIGVVLGIIQIAHATAYLNAVSLVPVSVAVIVIYLYPSFVALLAKIFDNVNIGYVRALCITGAFLGVALTTGTKLTSLNSHGLILAGCAAVTAATLIHLGGKFSRAVGSVTFGLLAFCSATVIIGIWTVTFGDMIFPNTAIGWIGAIGAGMTFSIGVLSFFTALKVLDSVKATIISNLEPLFAICIGVVVLGEGLSTIQLIGAALVVGAVMVSNVAAPG